MRVFLIGFMGVGKTTIGKRLASSLEVPFLDLDHWIESQEGMTVQEIFDVKGEKYFRALEKEWVLQENKSSGVYALGGGTPCNQDHINALLSQGICLYLQMSSKALSSRLAQSKSERPLIAAIKHNPEALQSFVEEKLKERRVFYEKAPLIFNCHGMNAERYELLADLLHIKWAHRPNG